MMKKNGWPSRILENLVRDFPVPMTISVLLFFVVNGLGLENTAGILDNAASGLMPALCLSAALSAMGRGHTGWRKAAAVGAAAVIFPQFAQLLPGEIILGIVLFSIALGVWAVCRGGEQSLRLNQVAEWFLACAGVTAVLMIALTGIALALNELLFSGAPDMVKTLIGTAALTLPLCLAAPGLFLGGVWDCRGERFRWVNGRLLLPMYLALMAVLLAYVGRILITWEMPVGTMNGFALTASALYVFFHLTLDAEDGRAAAFFRKWGAWAMLPILAAQAVGVVIRVAAYGLTADRASGIVVTLLCAGAVAAGLVRRRAGWFLPAAACVALVLPLAAEHTAILNQEHRLISALERNGMLTESREIIPNPEADPGDQRIIWDAADYLLDNDGREDSIAGWIRKTASAAGSPEKYNGEYILNTAREAILGFKKPTGKERVWRSISFEGSARQDELDVAGYAYAKTIRLYSYLSVDTDGTAEEYANDQETDRFTSPLQPLFEAVYAERNEPFVFPGLPLTAEIGGEDCDLAPLFADLVWDEETEKYRLVNDRLTLPSGKELHVVRCYLYVNHYDGHLSGQLDFYAWLLTPEAK